jgi:DNA-binding protein Fis
MLAELHRCLEQGGNDLYDRVQAKFERHLFEVVLDHCRNNKSKAGEILGITRNTLAIKLKELSSERRDWKA